MPHREKRTDKQRHPGSWCFLAVRSALVYFGNRLHHWWWKRKEREMAVKQMDQPRRGSCLIPASEGEPSCPCDWDAVGPFTCLPSTWRDVSRITGLGVITLDSFIGLIQMATVSVMIAAWQATPKHSALKQWQPFAHNSAVWAGCSCSTRGYLESFLCGCIHMVVWDKDPRWALGCVWCFLVLVLGGWHGWGKGDLSLHVASPS